MDIRHLSGSKIRKLVNEFLCLCRPSARERGLKHLEIERKQYVCIGQL